MPLISGGLSTTEQGRAIVRRLAALTSKQIASDETVICSEKEGMLAIAGLQRLESDVEKVIVLSDKLSLFAGRLFTKDISSSTVDAIPLERIKRSKGKLLGDSYWGRYLLLSFDVKSRSITLYRDPQGLSTIFYMRLGDDIFFSTEIALLYDALEDKPQLTWSYLVSFVANAHFSTLHTPFLGIYEAPAGCSTEISCSGQVNIVEFWDPTEIVANYILDEESFAEKIYETLCSSTAALTRGAQGVLVELSGGLDSSSVLSILKRVSPSSVRLRGVNVLHSRVASSNEETYARDVSDACDVPLQIIDYNDRPCFKKIKLTRRFNRPASFLFEQQYAEIMGAASPIGKNEEMVSGQGGDHLFLAPPPIESIADCLLDGRLRALHSKISEISAYHRTPYMTVISKALKAVFDFYRGTLAYVPLSLNLSTLVHKDASSLIDYSMFIPHNWEKMKRLVPGKAHHIFAISQAAHYIDRGHLVEGKPTLNPLLAQPLIELAISMPTYQSFSHGHNRYLFRKAMGKQAQGNFIWRKSKGEATGILILMIRESFNTFTEFALEGRFSQKGLLDRDLIEKHFKEFRHGKADNLWPLLNLIVAEMWLESWDL